MLVIPLALGLLVTFARVQADPLVPRLSGNDRAVHAGFQAVDVHLPWDDAGHLTLRFPETLHSSLGLLFIDHTRDDMPPAVKLDTLPDWTVDVDSGAASYEISLPNDITFGARIAPLDGRADLEFWVRNETDETLKHPAAHFCLMQTWAPPFSEGNLTRTYMHSGGEWLALARTTHEVMDPEQELWIVTGLGDLGTQPHEKLEGHWYCCPERADTPIIATTDPQGDRTIAITWDGGFHIMSNGRIPCIHCDPVSPGDIPPGETREWRGRICLLEGGLDTLWELLGDGQEHAAP